MKHAKKRTDVSVLVVACVLLIFLFTGLGFFHSQDIKEKAEEEAARIEAEHQAYLAWDLDEHESSKAKWAMTKANLDFLKEEAAKAEAERIAAEEAAYQEWLASQATYYEPTYYQAPYDTSDGISAAEFQWMGVIETEDHFYTYYSERVLPGGGLTELNSNGRHSEDGFVKDGDGYIAVASSDLPKGSIVDTPFGEGKVYDTGSLAPGQVDIYVSF